jgi:hypothetical protein
MDDEPRRRREIYAAGKTLWIAASRLGAEVGRQRSVALALGAGDPKAAAPLENACSEAVKARRAPS